MACPILILNGRGGLISCDFLRVGNLTTQPNPTCKKSRELGGLMPTPTIWDCFESKIGQAIQRVVASWFEKASMIELCVDKSYVKAFVMKKLCRLKHYFYVALKGVWDADCMNLATSFSFWFHLDLFSLCLCN